MMNETLWRSELPELLKKKLTLPKYQILADAVAAAIDSGQLVHAEQLPTVRDLAGNLGVSGTTVAAAYRLLSQKGLISGKVGSGTRVAGGIERPLPAPSSAVPLSLSRAMLWRRRSQTSHIATLLRAHPHAQNYASGTPNPDLLPLEVLQRAWVSAAEQTQAADLQYGGPAPLPALSDLLLERLGRDMIPARASDLVIGSSAQQLLTLAVQIAAGTAPKAHHTIGLEEPGYPTLLDAYERLGHRLVGIELDGEGVLPVSLEGALKRGVSAVVLTPRAHNPTGVSWSPARLVALADVLASFPGVLIIEDDPFAEAANSRVGSLLHDPRLEDRVIYIRSFSKVIAPALRLAVAVARPPLRAQLIEGKFYSDGWSSSFSQRALANAFADPALEGAIDRARQICNRRREAFAGALHDLAAPGTLKVSSARDGVNVWLELGHGVSAAEVAERAAASGVLVAAGEPFFVEVGRDDALRVNIGMMADEAVTGVARKLVAALEDVASSTPTLFSHHGL